MSQSAQPGASKRKRLLSPSDELPDSTRMSGSPPPDIVSGTARLPSHQTGSIDTESLLLEMIETEAGAAELAQALNSRRIRDVLKQHGVKIQTNDHVGYNSLPLELRDSIRQFVIADVDNEHGLMCRCGHCTRLAPYACINSEWRDAVERVTFRHLSLKDRGDSAIKDLELLERYVVGSRQQCLQYIGLPVDTLKLIGESSDEDKVEDFTSPILQLFNVLNQWDGWPTAGGNLSVALHTTSLNGWVAEPFSMPLDGVHARLTDLSAAAQVTDFCVSLWEPLDVRSMQALLSHMPNLRSLTIMPETTSLPENDEDCFLQTKLFFDSLPQTAPNLGSLEIKCYDALIDEGFHMRFHTEALLYSQRLREFSIVEIRMDQLPAILAPFSTENFDPNARPPLLWPNLTVFIIKQPDDGSGQDEFCVHGKELLLRMGRAIRSMPRIQYLEMGFSYFCHPRAGNRRFVVVLEIESSRGSFCHNPLAKLLIAHGGDESVAENVPAREMTDLWKESIFKASGAILEVEVISMRQEGASMSTADQVEEIEED